MQASLTNLGLRPSRSSLSHQISFLGPKLSLFNATFFPISDTNTFIMIQESPQLETISKIYATWKLTFSFCPP